LVLIIAILHYLVIVTFNNWHNWSQCIYPMTFVSLPGECRQSFCHRSDGSTKHIFGFELWYTSHFFQVTRIPHLWNFDRICSHFSSTKQH